MMRKWVELQEKDFTSRGADTAGKSLNKRRVRMALRYLGKNEKVLDLGCNDGSITNEIAKKGNEVIGVDLKKVVEKLARKKFPHLNFIAHDLSRKFPWPDKSFDKILALELIEHIPDDSLFLKECYRILKEKGGLILSTTNIGYFPHRIELAFGKFRPPNTHIHHYTFKSIQKKLENAGFKIVEQRGTEYEDGPKKWYWIEKVLPKTFKANIIIYAAKL